MLQNNLSMSANAAGVHKSYIPSQEFYLAISIQFPHVISQSWDYDCRRTYDIVVHIVLRVSSGTSLLIEALNETPKPIQNALLLVGLGHVR